MAVYSRLKFLFLYIINLFFPPKATRKAKIEEVDLDIYLMNGNKFAINVLSTDETEEVLEVRKNLVTKLIKYMALR